jgi:rhodanese-related sulfurtransferase
VAAQDFYTLYYRWPAEMYAEQIDSTDDMIIIDVRTPMEYKQGHIENAINISYLGFGFKRKIAKLDNDLPVFIYCQTAHRSPLAAKALHKQGFKEVHDLNGGFKTWKEQDLPIVGID